MANVKPYYTSTDLVEAVKRKISLPLSQQTFTSDDVLAFSNEEMFLSQVPSIILYHQEYFVFYVDVPLLTNTSRYALPDRSIGMKMRGIFYKDVNGDLFEMTQIAAEDKAYFQRNVGANSAIHKFYIEGNDVCLLPEIAGGAQGFLRFQFYLRPNQLVDVSRAATVTALTPTISEISKNFLSNNTFVQISPTNTITIPSHGFYLGNKIMFSSTGTLPSGLNTYDLFYIINPTTNTFQVSKTINGSAVSILDLGSGVQTITRQKDLDTGFQPEDVDFVNDLFTLINHDYVNNDMVMLSTTGVLPTPFTDNTFYYVVNKTQDTIQLATTLGGSAIDITFVGNSGGIISSDITTITLDQVPANITGGSYTDFLQTNGGHRTYGYDILLPTNSVSGNTILLPTVSFPVPTAAQLINNGPDLINGFTVGDYIASANECIIPQIPSDLHNGLAERVCARILAAMGDQQGLANVNAKIQEIDARQGTLLDNRDEGNIKKVTARHSLLRYSRFFGRRRV